MSYFVINKQMDFDRGYLRGGVFQEGRLGFPDGSSSLCFISRVFDSREEETEWGRAVLDAPGNAGAALQLAVYASGQDWMMVGGRHRKLQDLIKDTEIPEDEKEKLFRPLLKKRFVGNSDVLLNGITGRYLFIMLTMFRQEAELSCGSICLYFPKRSWLDYLPAVYRMDPEGADFTERFLGIFQSLYDDRDREIRESAGLMCPETCPRALLEQLAEWHDVKDSYLWPDDRLRVLIARIPEFEAMRGTLGGLRESLKLYTGEEPVIREEEDPPGTVTVGVHERFLRDAREYGSLRRIIGHMMPAGLDVRVVPLRQRMQIGFDVYVGVNSAMTEIGEMKLDGTSPAGLAVLGGREAEE